MARAFAGARKRLGIGLAICVAGVAATGASDVFLDALAGIALLLFLAATIARPPESSA